LAWNLSVAWWRGPYGLRESRSSHDSDGQIRRNDEQRRCCSLSPSIAWQAHRNGTRTATQAQKIDRDSLARYLFIVVREEEAWM
jgi:hypothetical protein